MNTPFSQTTSTQAHMPIQTGSTSSPPAMANPGTSTTGIPGQATQTPSTQAPHIPEHQFVGKKFSLQSVFAGLALVLLLVGGGVAYYLSMSSQEIRQQASGLDEYDCSALTSGACANQSVCSWNGQTNSCVGKNSQNNGTSCSAGANCKSGSCVDNKCASASSSPTAEMCNQSTCTRIEYR